MTALLALGLAVLAVILAQLSFRWLPLGKPESSHGPDHVAHRPQPLWWWTLIVLVAASPVWLSLLQLIPLSAGAWSKMAGHANYLDALRTIGAAPPAVLPVSLNPDATWAAMWSALPLAAVFLAALTLSHDAIEKLLGLMVLAAILQVVFALFQLVQGAQSFFYFGSESPGGINGTFNNRNHLADLLAMLIPVWFYFLLRQQKDRNAPQASSSRMTHAAFRPLWIFLGFTLMVLILTTQSRGGLFSGIVVLLLSAFVYLAYLGSRITFRHWLGMLALLAIFGIAALASVGTEGIASRLESTRLRSDADFRGELSRSTIVAARELWPWGSGVGSYESVFPRFQDMQSTSFIEYAHNDYPQLLMELGAPVLLIAAMLIALVAYQAARLFQAARRQRGSRPFATPMRWFCGIGALALLLHSRVEFNMHIPALAITATFLIGIFLRPVRAVDG